MAKILENKRKTEIRAYKRHLRILITLKKSKFIKRFSKTRFKRKPGLRDFSPVTEESLKSRFDCTTNLHLILMFSLLFRFYLNFFKHANFLLKYFERLGTKKPI